MHVNKSFLLSEFIYRQANFNVKFIIETTITLERKHNMARGISKRALATLVHKVSDT